MPLRCKRHNPTASLRIGLSLAQWCQQVIVPQKPKANLSQVGEADPGQSLIVLLLTFVSGTFSVHLDPWSRSREGSDREASSPVACCKASNGEQTKASTRVGGEFSYNDFERSTQEVGEQENTYQTSRRIALLPICRRARSVPDACG